MTPQSHQTPEAFLECRTTESPASAPHHMGRCPWLVLDPQVPYSWATRARAIFVAFSLEPSCFEYDVCRWWHEDNPV